MTDLLPLDLDELEGIARDASPENWSDERGWKKPFAVSTFAATFDVPTVLRLIDLARRSLPSPVEGVEEGNSPSVADIAMRGTTASHPEGQHSAGGCAADHAKYLGKCPYCHTALNLTMERR